MSKTLNELRGILEQSRDPSDSLLMASDAWQRFIDQGDNMLEAVTDTIKAAAELYSTGAGSQAATRGASDVAAATRALMVPTERGKKGVEKAPPKVGYKIPKSVLQKAYGDYADGRKLLYEAADKWGISTTRSGSKHTSKDLGNLSDDTIHVEMMEGAKALRMALKKTLDQGVRTTKLYRKFSTSTVMPTLPQDQVMDAAHQTLIDEGLNFRDAVNITLFARVNGIMRRAVELLNRAWQKGGIMRRAAESVGIYEETRATWDPPWADDPEIGDTEVI